MTNPEYRPIVTRLPEALAEEADAIREAYDEAEAERVKRALAETDQERLLREQAEGK